MRRCSEKCNILEQACVIKVLNTVNRSNRIYAAVMPESGFILPEWTKQQIGKLVEYNPQLDERELISIHGWSKDEIKMRHERYDDVVQSAETVVRNCMSQLDQTLDTVIVALNHDVDNWQDELQCFKTMKLKDINIDQLFNAQLVNMLGVKVDQTDAAIATAHIISTGKFRGLEVKVDDDWMLYYIADSAYQSLKKMVTKEYLEVK